VEEPFGIAQYDTRPPLECYLRDNRGIVDLTDAEAVTFTMRSEDEGTVVVNAQTCQILDAETGLVRYNWDPADTDTSGTFHGQFRVRFAVDDFERFPNLSRVRIVVHPSV
jgi:hypothetical protein